MSLLQAELVPAPISSLRVGTTLSLLLSLPSLVVGPIADPVRQRPVLLQLFRVHLLHPQRLYRTLPPPILSLPS